MSDRYPPEVLDAAVARVLDIHLHRELGLELLTVNDGRAGLQLVVGPAAVNNADMLHGGIVYAVLDVAAYLATLTRLAPGENAVTHDIHVSVMRPVVRGATVTVTGAVRRRGRSLIFAEAEASVGDRTVATGRVTKSVVSGVLPT